MSGFVYGGGSVGLMGAVAKSVLDHGGSVTGIIPEFLRAKGKRAVRVQEMVVTPDCMSACGLMFERSDAFVALPAHRHAGELVEQMTWQQLGRHTKPVLLANIGQFLEPLLSLLTHMCAHRIHPANPEHRSAQARTGRGYPAAPARRRRARAGGYAANGAESARRL